MSDQQKTLVKAPPIVMPAVSTEQAIDAWNAYQELKQKIVQPDDVQIIQGKPFLKKSYYRKVKTFFNLSVSLINEERTTEKDNSITYTVLYRATAPNGANCDGDGACNSREKGRENTIHNTRSIAHTRAFNRAVSNLVGGGEVSAEEIDSEITHTQNVSRETTSQSHRDDESNEYTANESASHSDIRFATDKQRKMIYARSKKLGLQDEDLKKLVYEQTGKSSSKDLTNDDVQLLVKYFDEAEKNKDYA